ncbi:MAG: tRNA lysidine(34) synthetase TilS [Bacteroidales bacterium]|nr:tRNA lysidine(34) synthetase TilS [Bacteroidales bacterium]
MILLAVSGGIDSMYLMHMAPRLFPGASFAAAHCNFRLRGEESDGDEAFVREACAEKGLPCFVKRFDTAAKAAGEGISIEMSARELRYGWFAELCRGSAEELARSGITGFEAVAVAHNANDNAETLLLNLLRGCGIRGLCGMKEAGNIPGAPDIPLLRPMLGISRAEISAHMQANGLQWREDSTNAVNDCKRNIIRNELFPLLESINPAFLRTVGQDIVHFSAGNAILEDYAAGFFGTAGDIRTDGLKIDDLLSRRHWKFLLWYALEPFGFSGPTMEKLTALLERYASEPRGTVTIGGKTFESPDWTLQIHKGKLILNTR